MLSVSSAGERNFSASILFNLSSSNVYILLGTCRHTQDMSAGEPQLKPLCSKESVGVGGTTELQTYCACQTSVHYLTATPEGL